MSRFLGEFQGKVDISAGAHFFNGLGAALVFYLIALGINVWVLWHGVAKGIERLAKVAMPLLFLFAMILVVRVIFLGAPDPAHPENTVASGFAYLWNPDFTRLSSPSVWLAAAGQIFFTLSIGNASIHVYASYLKSDDDVALTGLTTSATNEFAEVILGGSIAIPVAVAFFGLAQTQQIAEAGSFDLGFAAMPLIFQKMGVFGPIYGLMWFALLFFAGITSSVALAQPMVSFFQDEFQWPRKRAVALTGLAMASGGLPCVFFLKHGFLDEMDFWAGTFLLVVFAVIEGHHLRLGVRHGEGVGRDQPRRRHPPAAPRRLRHQVHHPGLPHRPAGGRGSGSTPCRCCGWRASRPPTPRTCGAARLMMLGWIATFMILTGVIWRRRHRKEGAAMTLTLGRLDLPRVGLGAHRRRRRLVHVPGPLRRREEQAPQGGAGRHHHPVTWRPGRGVGLAPCARARATTLRSPRDLARARPQPAPLGTLRSGHPLHSAAPRSALSFPSRTESDP
ncbi:MAG: hypothetical protein AB2L07_10240 [Thermoanaerobaculaceae bacterium]